MINALVLSAVPAAHKFDNAFAAAVTPLRMSNMNDSSIGGPKKINLAKNIQLPINRTVPELNMAPAVVMSVDKASRITQIAVDSSHGNDWKYFSSFGCVK
jgi:hypothetical protein